MPHLKVNLDDNIAIIMHTNGSNSYRANEITVDFDDEYEGSEEQQGYEEFTLAEIFEVFRAIKRTKHFTDNSFDAGVEAARKS